MKNLRTLDNVVHYFANQLEESGMNSNGSLYFRGNQIYSYGSHWLLAEIINKDVILINNASYSNTTAKHRIKVMRGTSQYRQLDMRVRDINSLCGFFEDTYKKLINSKSYAFMHFKAAEDMWENFLYYFQQFESKVSIEDYEKVLKKYIPFESEHVKNIISTQKASAEKKQIEKEKRDKEREIESLKKFRTFESSHVQNYSGFSYLRVNGGNIETSQGVKVPLNAIEHLYKAICNGVNIVGKIVNNQFTIREQNENFIRVGCHKIEINEIKNVLSNEIK